MYSTYTGSIGCIMLMLWPHKYKVCHNDLILIMHQNLLNSPEILEFSFVSHMYMISKFHGINYMLVYLSFL